MKLMGQFLLSTILLFSGIQLQGQNTIGPNYNLALRAGFTFAGPVGPMANHLIEEGFDEKNVSFYFFGVSLGSTDYPNKMSSGGSLALTYSWNVKQSKRINLELGYSDLGNVTGYSTQKGRISFDFQSVYGAVYYSYFKKPWDLKIGPSVLFNTIKPDGYALNPTNFKETKISIGLFAGIGLSIWDGNLTYGRLNCDYIYAIPNTFGPFKTDDFETTGELPEASISFKHAMASFTFGLHL